MVTKRVGMRGSGKKKASTPTQDYFDDSFEDK